jgi:hypothetical protein
MCSGPSTFLWAPISVGPVPVLETLARARSTRAAGRRAGPSVRVSTSSIIRRRGARVAPTPPPMVPVAAACSATNHTPHLLFPSGASPWITVTATPCWVGVLLPKPLQALRSAPLVPAGQQW